MRPDAAALVAVPLFASLEVGELERVADWLEVRHAEAGERLVSEGASGYSFFVLLEGTAAVTQAGEEIAILGAGDFFGELAITGDGRRTATVTATLPVTLAAMHGTLFRLLERELPEVAARITSAAVARGA